MLIKKGELALVCDACQKVDPQVLNQETALFFCEAEDNLLSCQAGSFPLVPWRLELKFSTGNCKLCSEDRCMWNIANIEYPNLSVDQLAKIVASVTEYFDEFNIVASLDKESIDKISQLVRLFPKKTFSFAARLSEDVVELLKKHDNLRAQLSIDVNELLAKIGFLDYVDPKQIQEIILLVDFTDPKLEYKLKLVRQIEEKTGYQFGINAVNFGYNKQWDANLVRENIRKFLQILPKEKVARLPLQFVEISASCLEGETGLLNNTVIPCSNIFVIENSTTVKFDLYDYLQQQKNFLEKELAKFSFIQRSSYCMHPDVIGKFKGVDFDYIKFVKFELPRLALELAVDDTFAQALQNVVNLSKYFTYDTVLNVPKKHELKDKILVHISKRKQLTPTEYKNLLLLKGITKVNSVFSSRPLKLGIEDPSSSIRAVILDDTTTQEALPAFPDTVYIIRREVSTRSFYFVFTTDDLQKPVKEFWPGNSEALAEFFEVISNAGN